MKKVKHLLFALLTLGVIGTSCHKDDIDAKDINPDPEVYGDSRVFTVNANFTTDLMTSLPECDIELHLLYEGSSYLSVIGTHKVVDGVSTFELDDFLKQGRYEVLGVDFPTTRGEADRVTLGLSVTVNEDYNVGPTTFCTDTQNVGEGTSDDPYIVSSAANLSILNEKLATDPTFSTEGMYFQQSGDLDFFDYILNYEDFSGICEDSNRPFMGVFNGALLDANGDVETQYSVRNLSITRSSVASEDDVPATGLFAHICGANLKNIHLEQPYISGYNFVGGLVGAVIGKSGSEKYYSYLTNCKLVNSASNITSTITGKMNVGGLVGGVDYQAGVNITNCANEIDNTGSTQTLFTLRSAETDHVGYCGGLVGGGASASEILLTNCTNTMPVTIDDIKTTAIGGLVGCAQTVSISNCKNSGKVSAMSGSLGTGGIIGGSIDLSMIAVMNEGDVTGGEGVGGIAGSSLLSRDEENGDTYGNISGSSMINRGVIKGELSVGGMVGAAQSSLSNCLNEGTVTSSGKGAGGMVGYAPGSITVSCYNVGNVSGSDNTGGIVGYAFYFLDNSSVNLGSVASSGAAGGILGMGGTVGTIDYSANYGDVMGDEEMSGGITGKVGTCAEEDVDHMLTVKEDGELTARTFFVFLSEKFEHKFKIAKIFSVLFKIGDALKGVSALWSGSIEEVELMDEKSELTELYEANKAVVETASDDYISYISTQMAAHSSLMTYKGDLTAITDGVDMAAQSYSNTDSFRQFLLLDDSLCDEYSEAVNETLVDIETREANLDVTKEAFAIIAECVISAIAVLVGGPEVAIVLGVADMTVSKSEMWTEDDNNAIVVSQSSNYGYTNGCGIVGKAGDQIQILDCLSAGKVGRYTIVDEYTRKANIERIVVTGEYDRDNMTQAWNGYDFDYGQVAHDLNILDVSLLHKEEYFQDEDYYDKYDFLDDDRWELDDGYLFGIPSDNQYLNFK